LQLIRLCTWASPNYQQNFESTAHKCLNHFQINHPTLHPLWKIHLNKLLGCPLHLPLSLSQLSGAEAALKGQRTSLRCAHVVQYILSSLYLRFPLQTCSNLMMIFICALQRKVGQILSIVEDLRVQSLVIESYHVILFCTDSIFLEL